MSYKFSGRFQNWILLGGLMVFLLNAMPVSADSFYDREKEGSVHILLTELDTPKEDVEFSLYQVGKPVEGTALQFECTQEFSDSQMDLNAIIYAEDQKEAAAELAVLAAQKEAKRLGKTDEAGSAVFSELPQGVYLVTQTEENLYGTVDPFLLFIPHFDKNSEWLYMLEVHPKAERKPQPTPTPTITPSPKPSVMPTPTPNVPTDGKIVQTGDEFPIKGIGIVFFVSVLAVVGLTVGYKKQSGKKKTAKDSEE